MKSRNELTKTLELNAGNSLSNGVGGFANVGSGVFWMDVEELESDVSEVVDRSNARTEHERTLVAEPFDLKEHMLRVCAVFACYSYVAIIE